LKKGKQVPENYGQPTDGYARELLTILAEECCEVAVRVSKVLRFGLMEVQRGQELTNSQRLAREVGGVQEVVRRLIIYTGTLSEDEITEGMIHKADKLDKFMQTKLAL
jgi:hypothetical protein